MLKAILILVCLLSVQGNVLAQKTTQATHAKFMQLTKMFHGEKPYSCLAIVEVEYKGNKGNALKDTSKLIYKNKSTYYKSPSVERVEGPQGELIINHELQTANFHVSDSIREIIYKELKMERDADFENALESDVEKRDLGEFNEFVIKNCNVVWETRNGLEEISFTAKNPAQSILLSLRIRFDKEDKVRYYEYTRRDVYANDWDGKGRFRNIRTIYDGFNYDEVPNIPSRLTEFLEWRGWTLKLKKYSNYKLSVL